MRKEQSILYISSPKSPRCGRIGKEIDAAPLLILLSQLAPPSLHVQLTHSICQDSCLHLFLNVCLAYSWQRGAIFRSTYCKVAMETLLSPRDGASQATSSTTYLTVLGKVYPQLDTARSAHFLLNESSGTRVTRTRRVVNLVDISRSIKGTADPCRDSAQPTPIRLCLRLTQAVQ